jgi:hypothetical protein
MTSHRDGQGAPPKVILRAMRSMLSKIVKLSAAVSLDKVPRLKAASISTLQINIFTLGCQSCRLTM